MTAVCLQAFPSSYLRAMNSSCTQQYCKLTLLEHSWHILIRGTFLCIGLYSNKHFLHSYGNNIDTVTSKGNCADKSVYPMQQVNDKLHMQSQMDSKPGTLKLLIL